MENPKMISFGAAFLFLCVLKANASPSVSVGALCTNNEQCGSPLLYCLGVCFCDRAKANSVVVFENRFAVGELLCEAKECIAGQSKEITENECDMENAYCTRINNRGKGFCSCPLDQMGSRRKEKRFSSTYGTECKDVEISSVGDYCIGSNSVCDTRKKLKCREEGALNGGKCGCFEGHVFDYEKDYCVTKEEFTNYHGNSKLGTYKQYCNSNSDCNGGMKCKSYQCDCPYFCSSGDFIKTDDLCYCPTDYKQIFLIVIPALAICLFVGVMIAFAIRKRNAALEEMRQNGTVLVIQPGTLGSRSVQVMTPQQAANLNLISDEQQQNINQQSNVPHHLPFNPEQHLQPTAPPQSSSYHQNPPSYSEVMQQQNMI